MTAFCDNGCGSTEGSDKSCKRACGVGEEVEAPCSCGKGRGGASGEGCKGLGADDAGTERRPRKPLLVMLLLLLLLLLLLSLLLLLLLCSLSILCACGEARC